MGAVGNYEVIATSVKGGAVSSVPAPTGKKVLSGSFTVGSTNMLDSPSYPNEDGTAWVFDASRYSSPVSVRVVCAEMA